MTETPAGSAWNPGIKSQIPWDLRPLCTIFRPENIANNLAAIEELRALTGLRPSELVVFRPGRLLLHELLIRVTADFAVPSGSAIGDLGINFRVMADRLLSCDLLPQMPAITAAYTGASERLATAVNAALAALLPGNSPVPLRRKGLIDRLLGRGSSTGPAI